MANSMTKNSYKVPGNFVEFMQLSDRKDDFTACYYTLWNIWLARNERVYKNNTRSPQQTNQIAILLSQEYKWAYNHKLNKTGIVEKQQGNNATTRNSNIMWVKWEPPPTQWLKINTDGASKGKQGEPPETTGAGWICRNSEGKVIMAMAAPIGKTTIMVAETWDFLLATRMATTQRWTHILFETDSTMLLTLLQRDSDQAPLIIQNMI
ncbi:uncharacterized protein LOC113324280 [Papaver somniferum]|uniref:uncharacterized protein LOC113324280 n=1 Tax=Papaver somniferum TaxID=3469 RepID=UPI000E6F8A93|nr:uncharacterized protein LOC113324280 [Papaver somniferum]